MKTFEEVFGPNSALVEDLFEQYKTDPTSIPAHWRNYFLELEGKPIPSETAPETAPETVVEQPKEAPKAEIPKKESVNGAAVAKAQKPVQSDTPTADGVELQKIKGVASRIVENMDQSIQVPTATSLRVMPVKMLIEDRTIINRHLVHRNEPKASFTHIIAWAIIKALKEYPNINNSYAIKEGNPYKVVPADVNLGLAVDVTNNKGERSLVVPNIKAVDKMNFNEFLHAYAALVEKPETELLRFLIFREPLFLLPILAL